MNHRIRLPDCKHARNAKAYAIGEQRSNGFHIRQVVWGRLLATHERRKGEKIRRAIIMIERGDK